MLSYQHAYHAGNSADVIKHFVQYLILQSLKKKETPFHFYDSHAGAGGYSLASNESRKTGEAKAGIEELVRIANTNPNETPTAVKDWLATLAEIQTCSETPDFYPGSPHWARHLMRAQDKATLLELHPTEYQKLRTWKGKEKRIKTFKQDSFKFLKAHLPPTSNRGLVLIDPPYELTSDYLNVTALLKEAIQRFATGIYLIWYPVVERGADRLMIDNIKKLAVPKTLWVEIDLQQKRSGFGLQATGIVILNCPWQVDETLAHSLPWIATGLSENRTPSYRMEWLVEDRSK